jgi:hypothetical protein
MPGGEIEQVQTAFDRAGVAPDLDLAIADVTRVPRDASLLRRSPPQSLPGDTQISDQQNDGATDPVWVPIVANTTQLPLGRCR